MISCKTKNDQANSESKTDKKENSETIEVHKNLLGFKTSFLAELGDGKYEELENKVEKGIIETKYINDIIYVSYYEELNACGQYAGNIEISNDTIKLGVNLVSDEVCTSLSIEKLTFLIDNPTENKRVIMKK